MFAWNVISSTGVYFKSAQLLTIIMYDVNDSFLIYCRLFIRDKLQWHIDMGNYLNNSFYLFLFPFMVSFYCDYQAVFQSIVKNNLNG